MPALLLRNDADMPPVELYSDLAADTIQVAGVTATCTTHGQFREETLEFHAKLNG